MSNDLPQPKSISQVMVSSTFRDLEEHRAELIAALEKHKLFPNAMEFDDARPIGDVVDASLDMVRDSAAYILVIGLKYGQIPDCASRNPNQVSLTELEFNEAQRLGRPTLLFIMGEDHLVRPKDIERDPEKEKKLNAFRDRAKKYEPESEINRVYSAFESLEDFKEKIRTPIAELKEHLVASNTDTTSQTEDPKKETDPDYIPAAPAFYAEPDYIGSHKFVGRDSQLQELSDWAKPADPTNLLLFEAIGGNGKSMLTWEWTTKHATRVRNDWAGRFWYSFYERGAYMADFCRRAMAYMTGRPLEEFRRKKTAELREPLLALLHAKPWLMVLDGLERVLVAYHRIDAAEMRDEEADSATDKISDRDPRDAIREEDNDLLRSLVSAAPSKILVSSRLTPRILLNPSGQPISNAKRFTLTGLRPSDAEKLLRSCGIDGDSNSIQKYLTENCDNHPLVIGILAGLIANYLPSRGYFDSWAADSEGGAKLDLANLDIIQRRNHILQAAFDDLSDPSRQLLSTLALLSESVDYETLSAFNPHPSKDTKELADTVRELEQRGLLQYEGHAKRHDLHPVIRGVAGGAMKSEDREQLGMRVVDHFSSIAHDPYEQAQTIEDLASGLNVVRTLIKINHLGEAYYAMTDELLRALLFNIEAYSETVSLISPLFPNGWGSLPSEFTNNREALKLANFASLALFRNGKYKEALQAVSLVIQHRVENDYPWDDTIKNLSNYCEYVFKQRRFAASFRIISYCNELSRLFSFQDCKFVTRYRLFSIQTRMGLCSEADETWSILDPMGREWHRQIYRPGSVEYYKACLQFARRELSQELVNDSLRKAQQDRNRIVTRELHRLNGIWRFEQCKWSQAGDSFAETIQLARASSLTDAVAETGLAIAKLHLGKLSEPVDEAERLSQLREPAHRLLAQLWLEIGDQEKAKHHALKAYKWAWADGEPYVHRLELDKTVELLEQMNVPIPELPPYDPKKDEPFPWEADIQAAIEKLRKEKEQKEQNNAEEDL